jgi:hypothetical protein
MEFLKNVSWRKKIANSPSRHVQCNKRRVPSGSWKHTLGNKLAASEKSEPLELSITGIDEGWIRVELAIEVEAAHLGMVQGAFVTYAEGDEELRPG